MGVLSVTLVTALFVTQAAELPPPFPRPGTTKLLENDAVAVWDVSWLKQKYPLHTHRYDLVGISYAEGDRIITQGDAPGRLVPTKAWVFQTNRAGVTHVEEGIPPFEPECAIVPRFSISSSRFMPMPLSAIVRVRADLTGVSTTR